MVPGPTTDGVGGCVGGEGAAGGGGGSRSGSAGEGLEKVAKAAEGGYCRLEMSWKRAVAVRKRVARP